MAVMFRGQNAKLKFKPETGMEVIVKAKLSVYVPRGNYQLVCESMEPVGAGALQKAFEQLKAKLKQEGLFDLSRKKTLPPYPQRIAIITSPTGAAIQDMLNVLRRRFKGLEIHLAPCKVQGEQAPQELIQAIDLIEEVQNYDILIIGRGGGSQEDLWAFNDEKLARRIAACKIPVVSAVGHEIDFSICDFVADLRAPTPSAAAELIVKNRAELLHQLQKIQNLLANQIEQNLKMKKQQLLTLKKSLISPEQVLQMKAQRLDDLTSRLETSSRAKLERSKQALKFLRQKLPHPKELLSQLKLRHENLQQKLAKEIQLHLQNKQNRLKESAALLNSLSPLAVLDRGYSITKYKSKLVRSAKEIQKGEKLELQFSKGSAKVIVESKRENS